MSAAFSLEQTPRRRRLVSLTPMIDVVFLLLVFFMLVSRFAVENAAEVSASQSAGAGLLEGAPRLVLVEALGVRLNGAPIALEDLGRALLERSSPGAAIVLQADGDVSVQRLIDVIDVIETADAGPLLLME